MIPSLAPWAEELRSVNAEIAAVLGPLLPRLDRLLSQAFGHDERAQGDPDGLDGLSRRGPPERLLLSEWALALEAPDEFLRRAGTRELLYSAIARRGVAPPPRRILAVLDAGPGSLGAPRLAQLALLLALARQARERGVKLGVGAMHNPDGGLLSSDGAARILQVLAQRTRELPPPDAAARWQSALGGEAVHGLWVVGRPGLDAPAPRGWSTLRITEDPGGGEELRVELSRDGRPLGRLELSGLEGEERAKLLVDPFRPPLPTRPPPSGAAWNRGLLQFVARGDYLLGQVRPGQLVAWHLRKPHDFRRKSTRKLYYDKDQTLVATGWNDKRLHAITLDGDELTIWRTGHPPRVVSLKGLPARPSFAVAPTQLYGAGRMEGGVFRQDLFFVDGLGQLWCLGLDGHLARFSGSVSAVAEDSASGVCFLVDGKILSCDAVHWPRFQPISPSADVATLPPAQWGLLGGYPRFSRSDELTPGHASLWFDNGRELAFGVRQKQLRRIPCPPGHQVYGVSGYTFPTDTVPALVAVRPGDHRLVVILEDGAVHEHCPAAPVPQTLAVSPTKAQVAWVDPEDRLHHYNLCTREHRVLRPGELP